ncbi:MAG: TRAP transporter substrate-binding protein DctP [Clostridia bacterium]|nr:TRAP transporter substrate-binding protein DctP [Clostridia bacterium]
MALVVPLLLVLLLSGCGGARGTKQGASTAAPPSQSGQAGQQTGPAQQGQGAGASAAGRGVTLKVADYFQSTHWGISRMAKPWMERVTELTGGRVKFDYYPSEQLGKQKDMLDMATNGVADVTMVVSTLFPGQLPLTGFITLPGAFQSSTQGTRVFLAMMKEEPIVGEYLKNGVRPLVPAMLPPYEVFSKKPVRRPQDLKGLKVRTTGGSQEYAVKALGGVPVAIATPELYTALQRGTVDGTVISYASAKEYRLDEVVRYGTSGASVTSAIILYVIGEKVWQSLDSDIRKAMEQAGQEVALSLADYLDAQTTAVAKEFAGKGVQIAYLTDEEKKEWRQVLAPVWDQWVGDMTAKGLPGRQVVDRLRQALATTGG